MRESSSLYHRVKHLQAAVAVTAILTLLVRPAPVAWLPVGLPLAVAGARARLQRAHYKKHL